MREILFVCVHNAGRSQMAEAILNAEAKKRALAVQASSAGTLGGVVISPVAKEALGEIGISMDSHFPKVLTQDMVAKADTIISMGCGVDAEACPTRFLVTDDWGLDDPAGQPIERVRIIRDQILAKVTHLLDTTDE